MKLKTEFREMEYCIEEISRRYGGKIFNDIESLTVTCAEKTAFRIKNGEVQIQARTLSEAYNALGSVLAKTKRSGQVHGEVRCKVKDLGVMLDCARNAVPNMESLKKFIAGIALMGYTYLELYVEDCFEVTDEPYFGYMRGRFHKEELKEIDRYCRSFGIELVPCIQTLAHLARIFLHWKIYTGTIQDKGDVLLVGEDRTYLLIENMIKTCRECFSSKRINIGMDEAFELGKGKYFQKHGYVPSREIMRQHLPRVTEICRKYGFEPSLWADMFYEDLEKGETQDVEKGLNLIFWEYCCEDKEYYQKKFSQLRKSGLKYSFAGGAHKWYGFTPLNAFSAKMIDLQFGVAQKNSINDFMVTLWGDDGAECSCFSVFSSLAYLGEKNLFGAKGFANGLCKRLTGYRYTELQALDLPNQLYDSKNIKLCNPSKYLFYVDPLLGIEEFTSAPDYVDRYKNAAARLKTLAKRRTGFSYLYKTAYRLCDYLEIKSTLTEDIDKAYKSGDKAGLSKICYEKMPQAEKRLQAFIRAFQTQWTTENRPFGFEVEEYRLYGALGRLSSVREKLSAYVSGKAEKIEELEEIKLSEPIDPSEEHNGCRLYNGVTVNVTYGSF